LLVDDPEAAADERPELIIIDDDGKEIAAVRKAPPDTSCETFDEVQSRKTYEQELAGFQRFEDATQQPVFRKLYTVARGFLEEYAKGIDLDINVAHWLDEWLFAPAIPVSHQLLESDPDIMWRRMATDSDWRPFAGRATVCRTGDV
jgi:hypothetical protein